MNKIVFLTKKERIISRPFILLPVCAVMARLTGSKKFIIRTGYLVFNIEFALLSAARILLLKSKRTDGNLYFIDG